MSATTIQAQARSVLGKKVKALRKSGTLPAVLYGHGLASRSLIVSSAEFLRAYRSAGESTLIDLVVDGQVPVKVIIQDVQRHPVTQVLLHVDFHQVKMTEKLHAEIPLSFTGEAPAVKELGGVLVKNIDRVKVESLPGDLVHEVVVDVSTLKTLDDKVLIRNLPVPKGITVLERPDDVVCLVAPPRSEAELAELEEKVEEKVEEVEGVKKEEAGAAAPTQAEGTEEKDQGA